MIIKLTVSEFSEATCVHEQFNEFYWERGVSVVDIADVDGVLDSSLLVDQVESLN